MEGKRKKGKGKGNGAEKNIRFKMAKKMFWKVEWAQKKMFGEYVSAAEKCFPF